MLDLAFSTDPGRRRARNEDAGYAGGVADDWVLLVVADGLGGHARGDWASTRAVELLRARLATDLRAGRAPGQSLQSAFKHASWAIYAEALAQGTAGAATTLVCALVRDEEWWWAHVGDSRLYRSTGDRFEQVTTDHSWVNERVVAGELSPAEARAHPHRNVVTRTIGFEPAVKVDAGGPLTLASGDCLLLCSDGLFGVLEDSEIQAELADPDLHRAARRLVRAANEAGGPDNITVALGRRR